MMSSATDSPLLAGSIYGLRTWTVTGEPGDERLAGPQQRAQWPSAGEWLYASCAEGHGAPAPDCGCGVHAWHPHPRSARHVLASRRELPGVVEARGEIEVHEEGFRAARARPHALLLMPGRNAALARRLGETYGLPVVEVRDAGDALQWCSARGLGLTEDVVAGLLGPDEIEARRAARRAKARTDRLRVAAAVAVAAALVVAGLQLVTDPPGERTLQGRTGEVKVR